MAYPWVMQSIYHAEYPIQELENVVHAGLHLYESS